MRKDGEVVYERGKPLKNREDLELLQIVLMDDMAQNMRNVAGSQKKEQFEGRVLPKTLICSETVQLVNLLQEAPYTPWAKTNFSNDGPNTALVSINNAADWNTIAPNDQLEVDFLKAERRIEIIYYKCPAAGQTATVTATGKW